MKIWRILHVILSFLAVNISLGSYIVAAETFELKQTSQEISGTDSESGVAFHASLLAGDRVVFDAYFDTKRIHAEIDYARGTFGIRSVSQANGSAVALSVQDIVAFQKLLVSLPPKIDTASRHGNALARLVNLIASAPEGVTFDITGRRFTNESFTSICPRIGGPGVAIYRLKRVLHYDRVTVGPICYRPPALGRCGAGGGPDRGIGWLQPFTQECLNHDQCCNAAGNRQIGPMNICGKPGTNECVPEFLAAAPGFLGAPDCGGTAGNWTDNFGNTFILTDDNAVGDFRRIMGTANVANCGAWDVNGLRDGKKVAIGAFNPTGGGQGCPGAYQFVGFYCNIADGSRISSSGGSAPWNWKRTNTVGPTVSLGRGHAEPRSAAK